MALTLDQQRAIALANARARAAAASAQPTDTIPNMVGNDSAPLNDVGLPGIGTPPSSTTPPLPSFGDKLNNFVGGVNNAMYSIPQSVAELAARGTDAIGLSNGAYPVLHKQFQDARELAAPVGVADPNSKFFKGGEIAGQVATTLPLGALNVGALASKVPLLESAAANFPRAAGLAGRVASGAAQGASAAGLTSASNDAPLGQQVGMGAAFGGGLPLVAGGLKGIGSMALPLLLGETTGGGARAVKQAFSSGLEGGDAGAAFRENLRNPSSWQGVVDDVKTALDNMKLQRSQAYRSGMTDISKDATVLSFDPVDQAMAKASGIKSFKGIDLSPKTAEIRAEIDGEINKWKALDPAEYHTPEGFDGLKQIIGGIKDAQLYGTPQRAVAENAYSAIRQAIAKQAPVYDKVMKDYSQASDELSSLTREFSLGPKGNPNTALRRLQSIMRDNANTSWGNRVIGAQTLQDAGATNLMPALAGQALSSPLPRGLNKFADIAGLATALGTVGPAALAGLPFASPRVVGEGAHLLGRAAALPGRGLNAAGLNLANMPKPSLATLLGATAPGMLLMPNAQ